VRGRRGRHQGVLSSHGMEACWRRQLGLDRRSAPQICYFCQGLFLPLKIIKHYIIVGEVPAKPRPDLGCHLLCLALVLRSFGEGGSEATLHGRRHISHDYSLPNAAIHEIADHLLRIEVVRESEFDLAGVVQ
jgi:hypothetical protein